MQSTLTPDQLAADLAVRDLTDPDQGPHALQALVDIAAGAIARRCRCAVRVHRGPRIVSRADNYDLLNYPPDAVTRDARYTRYVDEHRMLRSHTSALVPPALRALAADAEAGDRDVADVLLVCPGITYRRDAIDRLHTGTPHQLDLWRIARHRLDESDLDDMVEALAGALVPGRPWRAEPRAHPYTLAGRQVDVDAAADPHAESERGAEGGTDREWVEVWECGLAHPGVLEAAGLAGWSGLALGMGLDRLLMLRKGIPDIRLLRSTDPRVAEQMVDLGPYRPVSGLPPIRRDLSVAVPHDDTAEDIGDRVRTALGGQADLLEAVTVVAETAYRDLPPAAVERLGIGADQKNVLVRLVVRPHDRTLTDSEANRLRDRVYAAVHRGATGQWAAAAPP